MRRVALIHNPVSGQHSPRRSSSLRNAIALLRNAGLEVEVLETNGAGSARELAQRAVDDGCDTILAFGGDGTMHEILQVLVGTSVALGVVPLGTANALAHNLGISTSPVRAVRALLTAEPVSVRVGRVFFHDATGQEHSRYFTVAAGIGLDALLMARPDPVLKRRFGYAIYAFEAVRIWLTCSFPLFEIEFTPADGSPARVERVSELLSVRIRNFGGLLRTFIPGASLHNGTLHLLAFKTRSRLRYLKFMLAIPLGRHTFSNGIELIEAASIHCRACAGSTEPIYVEADGEALGTLPVRMEVAPPTHTVTLLMPPNTRP